MRLALVTNTLPPEGGGGAEAYVAHLAREFGGRHDVLVLTAARAAPPGIETVRLAGLPPLRHEARPAAKALWHARDQWLPIVHREVRRALERFKPDVVHTHAVQGLSAAVFTAIRSLGVRHIHTAHDLGLLCARVTMTRDGEYCGGKCVECRVQRAVRARAAASRLDFLIAPSDHIRRRHIEFGVVDEAQTVTIRQGAAPAEAVERPIGAPATPRLGYIGSLSRVKGIETLLDAFRDAPPHWRLVIGGNGELEPLAARRAAEDGRIEFLGRIDEAAKEDFYRELDVLVIPSEWEENAPLVAVEAAIRGLPTVVSDRGGLPEIQGAEVFRSRDPAALLAAVGRVVDSPDVLSAKSRALIGSRERFLWATHVAEVEKVLHQASASAR